MTKRIQIIEKPFNDIQVGERVMFLSTSYNCTRVRYGFYRGTHMQCPVVEYFYRERKWRWSVEKKKYIQDQDYSISSKRVFLGRGRIFNATGLQKMLDVITTFNSLVETESCC